MRGAKPGGNTSGRMDRQNSAYGMHSSPSVSLTPNSGKELRSAQNHRAYIKRKAKSLPKRLSAVPRNLRYIGNLPIPSDSTMFRAEFQARYDNDNHHNSQATIWNHPPPYPDFNEEDLEWGLDGELERLHGWFCCLQHNSESKRLRTVTIDSESAILETVRNDFEVLLPQCVATRALVYHHRTSPHDFAFGKVYLQWKVRRLLSLEEDWKALRKGGRTGLLNLFDTRWKNM